MRSRIFYALLALVWMALIFYYSNQPEPFPYLQLSNRPLLGILGHMGEYTVLQSLLYLALRGRQAPDRRAFLLALAVTMLYALSDELHQRYVPGRTFSLLDLGYDLTGALLSGLVWLRG